MPQPPHSPSADTTGLAAEVDAILARVQQARRTGEAATFGAGLRVFLDTLRLTVTVASGFAAIGEDTLALARAGRPQRYLTPAQITQLVVALAGLYPERLPLLRYQAWLVVLHVMVTVERTLAYLARAYGGAEDRLAPVQEAGLRRDLWAALLVTTPDLVRADLERVRLSYAGQAEERAASATADGAAPPAVVPPLAHGFVFGGAPDDPAAAAVQRARLKAAREALSRLAPPPAPAAARSAPPPPVPGAEPVAGPTPFDADADVEALVLIIADNLAAEQRPDS